MVLPMIGQSCTMYSTLIIFSFFVAGAILFLFCFAIVYVFKLCLPYLRLIDLDRNHRELLQV